MAGYLNQTIRELHFEPTGGSVVFYEGNSKEQLVTATSQERQVWELPRPALFQGLAAVRYDRMWDGRGNQVYARQRQPGPRLETEDYCYYRVGQSFVFGGKCGYGGVGATISLFYFEYPRSLIYYAANERPATWNPESFTWSYLPAYDSNEEQRALARELVSNWLIQRWEAVLEEGLRAKIYKRLSDDVRQRTSYSLYSQLRQGLYTSEIADVGVFESNGR
jgi:hypothetical protein